MIDIFGPQTHRLLRLITDLSDMRAEDVKVVADAWRRISAEERAAAWSAIQHGTDTDKRIAIRNAALVARHQALIVSQARGLREAAFPSAAWDAAAAVAAAPKPADEKTYWVLTYPMATTLPWLMEEEQPPEVPQQRSAIKRGAWNEPARTSRGGRG